MKLGLLLAAIVALNSTPVQARHHHKHAILVAQECHLSPRGEAIVKAMSGFGSARLLCVPIR